MRLFVWCNCASYTFVYIIKGYLHCKMAASQNVPSKAQIKIFFYFVKKLCSFSRHYVFVFLTIPWFTKSVTSRWVLVHEIRCIFDYIFWTTNHEVTKLGQLIDINKDNNFQWSFEQFGRLKLDSKFFLI